VTFAASGKKSNHYVTAQCINQTFYDNLNNKG